ncbi:8013_t:CDS:2 [Acaulospora morrowiae]|uniref:8013_t:CDS:1 n=1 Tax=Acaulospora morrowiae TaxID=94023 RepID=A0A9N8ZDT7_9GLOM|nr:8013_t:CDS:2 [Acaulospora morrowiae]
MTDHLLNGSWSVSSFCPQHLSIYIFHRIRLGAPCFGLLQAYSHDKTPDITAHEETPGRVAHAVFTDCSCCKHGKGDADHYQEHEYPPCKDLTGEVQFVEMGIEKPSTRLIGQFNTGFLADDKDYYYQVDGYPKEPLSFAKVSPPGTAPFQVDLAIGFDHFAGNYLKIFHGNETIGRTKIIEIKPRY